MIMMYDTIVLGGGPGGVAAGIYCARKKMKTLFLTDSVGGQSSVSATIENWVGNVSVAGHELARMLDTHLRSQEDIDIHMPEKAVGIRREGGGFAVETETGTVYETKTVVIATGGRHRHLEVPGEDTFQGKGVVYCSTCDAPFFRNKTVAVIGGGNSGLEACQDLFPYAQKIFLISRGPALTGDPVLQEQVGKHPKVEIIVDALTKEIIGDKVVTGIRYEVESTTEMKELTVSGVFVEIGSVPNSEFVKDFVARDGSGAIIVDHRTMATSVPGVFAAGDVTDAPYRQNNISAGQGVVAALSAYDFVRKGIQNI